MERAASHAKVIVSNVSDKPKLTPDQLQKGLLVTHPKFEMGVIVGFSKKGVDSVIKVDFDDVGLKTLVLKYARLEVVR